MMFYFHFFLQPWLLLLVVGDGLGGVSPVVLWVVEQVHVMVEDFPVLAIFVMLLVAGVAGA